LGLPYDSVYRGRFDEDFVSDQVRRDFPHLSGQRGYYCFRDYATNRLIPLRFLEIIEVTLIGRVYYLEYAVKDIFDFPHHPVSLNDQILAFNQEFIAEHKNELSHNNPGDDLRPLVLMSKLTPAFHSEVDTITDDYDKEARRWAAAAKLLGSYPYFNYVPFLRIVALRGAADSQPRPVTKNSVLKSNQDYRLQLAHTLQSDSIDPHSINEERTERHPAFIERASFRLELRADQKIIDVQEPIIYITGEYDVDHFYFRTKDFGRATSTTITIDYIEKPPPVKNVDTRISIPLVLKPTAHFPLLRLASLSIFIAIYLVPHLYPAVFQYFDVNQRVVQDLSLVAISLTCFHLIEDLRRYAIA
jgi:hypothetical protein